MSKAVIYYWAPTNGPGFQDGIALVQDVDENNDFVLVVNTPGFPGVSSKAGFPGVFSYKNISRNLTTTKDVLRTINFTSDDNNSGCTFVINGIGAPVDSDGNPTALIAPRTEEVTGLNNNTVASSNIYSQIISITVTDDDATNVSVGYGSTGITNYLYVDSYRIFGEMTGSYQFIDQSNINATAYGSLNLPEYPNNDGSFTPFGIDSNPPVFIPAYVQRTVTNTNDLFTYNANMPLALVWNTISLTDDDTLLYDDSLYITVLQQGIR